jgi:hypothetical protein
MIVPEESSSPLKLTIELVPETCWGANLRDILTQAAWNRLRRQVYAHFGHRCAICGAGGRLHCHEVWSYDDAAHVQHLEGCVALCEFCHHVKHFGMAGLLASKDKLDLERVIAHFCRVNGCDRARFRTHRDAAFALWRERSRYEWAVDLGALNPCFEDG